MIIITESQLRQLIIEELGIALEVKNAVKQIFPQLISYASGDLPRTIPTSLYDNYYNSIVTTRRGNFTTEIFGRRTSVTVTIYNFPNIKIYNDFIEQYQDALTVGGSYRLDLHGDKTNNITISLASVNGQIQTTNIKQTLQHELSHLYEQYKSDKDYVHRVSYGTAMGIMSNRNYSTIERAVSCIIYYSEKGESVAFENGFYSELMGMFEERGVVNQQDISKTYISRRREEIRKSLKVIENEGDTTTMKDAIMANDSNLSYQGLLKLATRTEQEYNRAIRRGWAKFCKDTYRQNA